LVASVTNLCMRVQIESDVFVPVKEFRIVEVIEGGDGVVVWGVAIQTCIELLALHVLVLQT